MKIVPQKISTIYTSMTVEYSKIRRLLPISNVFWLREIENDCYSVFIILPYWSLISRS